MKDSEKILHQLKEDIISKRINICVPEIYDKMLDKKSNDTGRSKSYIFLECLSTVFPENFEELFGKEVFNEIVNKVKIFYSNFYKNEGALSLLIYATENLEILDDEDINKKKMTIAKHISDIVYSGDGELVNRNGLRKILIQKDYAKQIAEASFNSIAYIYNKAYDEAHNLLAKKRFL